MKVLISLNKNKKIKTLFALFCILIVVIQYSIATSKLFPKVCMIIASFCMLGSFLVSLKRFIQEIQKKEN